MYVPGKLKDTSKVLVDIGTGFYIEKVCAFLDLTVSIYYETHSFSLFSPHHPHPSLPFPQDVKGAQDYFQRRMDFITINIEEVQKNLQEKHMIRESE